MAGRDRRDQDSGIGNQTLDQTQAEEEQIQDPVLADIRENEEDKAEL
jgi:hypothetical protein